jgi:predicted nuclease with TOPRIM domain
MARKKNEVEEELSQLRREREQMDERISRVVGELEELLAKDEAVQSKYVSSKVKEFQKHRDGEGSPLDAGGQA